LPEIKRYEKFQKRNFSVFCLGFAVMFSCFPLSLLFGGRWERYSKRLKELKGMD